MKSFLQDVNQRIIAWFSDADISAGQRWGAELAAQLEATNYGVICITQESLQSHWMLFEAGALSKSVQAARVCPYLIDVARRDLPSPLAQFQAKEANRAQTWELLQSVNLAMAAEALPESRLQRYFDTFWPTLEGAISVANRDLRQLPSSLLRLLLEDLPPFAYRTTEVEMYAHMAGLPVWRINLNQAAIHVWRESIQLAVAENKLLSLIEVLHEQFPDNPELKQIEESVRAWSTSAATSENSAS